MSKTIKKVQLEELEEARMWANRKDAYALLKEYTGIEAKPYTTYSFYDEVGNYIGDEENHTIRDLLENAYIEVIEESEDTE